MSRTKLGGIAFVVWMTQAGCVAQSPSIGAHESNLCAVPQGPTPQAGECASYPRVCSGRFDEQLGWHEVCEPDPNHCWSQFDEELGWHTMCDGQPVESGALGGCPVVNVGTYESYPADCSSLPTSNSTCSDSGECFTLSSRCYDVPGAPYDRFVTDWYQRICL